MNTEKEIISNISGNTLLFTNGTAIKLKGIRYMKRLGAIRSDGAYYYPESFGFKTLSKFIWDAEKTEVKK